MIVWSDERIKKNIIDIDNNIALDIIRKIKPKTFNYIDIIKNSNRTLYGFIAQEVSQYIPSAITLITDFIPNIYDKADVTNRTTITLKTKFTSDFEYDASGNLFNKIKFYDLSNNEISANITKIFDDKTFQIDKPIDYSFIFVYGQEVDNFNSLDKDSIYTVTTSAVKLIDKIVQDQQSQIADLQQKNVSLEQRVAAIEEYIKLVRN